MTAKQAKNTEFEVKLEAVAIVKHKKPTDYEPVMEKMRNNLPKPNKQTTPIMINSREMHILKKMDINHIEYERVLRVIATDKKDKTIILAYKGTDKVPVWIVGLRFQKEEDFEKSLPIINQNNEVSIDRSSMRQNSTILSRISSRSSAVSSLSSSSLSSSSISSTTSLSSVHRHQPTERLTTSKSNKLKNKNPTKKKHKQPVTETVFIDSAKLIKNIGGCCECKQFFKLTQRNPQIRSASTSSKNVMCCHLIPVFLYAKFSDSFAEHPRASYSMTKQPRCFVRLNSHIKEQSATFNHSCCQCYTSQQFKENVCKEKPKLKYVTNKVQVFKKLKPRKTHSAEPHYELVREIKNVHEPEVKRRQKKQIVSTSDDDSLYAQPVEIFHSQPVFDSPLNGSPYFKEPFYETNKEIEIIRKPVDNHLQNDSVVNSRYVDSSYAQPKDLFQYQSNFERPINNTKNKFNDKPKVIEIIHRSEDNQQLNNQAINQRKANNWQTQSIYKANTRLIDTPKTGPVKSNYNQSVSSLEIPSFDTIPTHSVNLLNSKPVERFNTRPFEPTIRIHRDDPLPQDSETEISPRRIMPLSQPRKANIISSSSETDGSSLPDFYIPHTK